MNTMEETASPLASPPPVKVGVVEDELIIAGSICAMLRGMAYAVPPPCTGYDEALAMLRQDRPDLVLLDINLGEKGRDGIDIARYIRSNLQMPFIFLTANSDAATLARAKEVTPNAFLVKPFLKEDLYTAIEIALHNFYTAGGGQNAHVQPGYLYIREGSVQYRVPVQEIQYLMSSHVYVHVYTDTRRYLVRTALQQYLEQPGLGSFIRIHRGCAVNRDRITRVTATHVYIGNTALPVSRTYRHALPAQL